MNEPEPTVDLKIFARNVVQMLQTDPRIYRSFGIFWWPVKRILKHYYTQENLYLLGDYEDADVAARVPDVGLQEMLQLAIAEHQMLRTFDPGGNKALDPDGDEVMIFDQDAGM